MPDDQRQPPPPSHDETDDKPIPTASRRSLSFGIIGFAILLVIVLVIGTATRVIARQRLHGETEADLIPTVSVVHPKPVHGNTLVLPGHLDAWSSAPVYARTAGYLRAWYVDIGAKVHAGQVLADIDTPDLDQQLVASQAALATSDAQRDLAATTNARWSNLVSQNAVSRQDADERKGDYAARSAMRNEALADVNRLRALTSFKQLIAPFDGMVTARNTDVGALIVAGGAGSTPLFTVADTSRLRLYVSVPQTYTGAIHDGMAAHFSVPEYPGRSFTAQIDRSSGAVDRSSGAMLIQLVYDNADGELKPGSYADVTFDLPAAGGTEAVVVPASSLLFRHEGTALAIAGEDGKVAIHPITIITDFGTELQIGAGAGTGDWIIDSPPDDIANGDKVKLKKPDEGKKSA